MMDYTDRHFRYLLRCLSPSALLYTEMVNAQAILRGDTRRLLEFDPFEHPVALQLGGSEPELLAKAASIGAEFGYDEINLNCGCPSDRVQAGRFGACLMAAPDLVAECVAAMRSAVSIPVTVKCRIGIEPRSPGDEYEFLHDFVTKVSAAGCRALILHARNAVLTGLSPKENREVPPLRFDLATRLRLDFPAIELVVNGGIRSLPQVAVYLEEFDGVMLGREICENPYRLAELHRMTHDPLWQPLRHDIIARYREYVSAHWSPGQRLAPMLRHVLALYAGQPRARSWRRFISERASNIDAAPDLLENALRIVAPTDATLAPSWSTG